MLANLQIKDFLLIDELELDFFNGLTVITGETGSGKSITIDALMLIFGAKASADIIRNGQNQASFSATFHVDNGKILTWLQTKEFLDSNQKDFNLTDASDLSGSIALLSVAPINFYPLSDVNGVAELDVEKQAVLESSGVPVGPGWAAPEETTFDFNAKRLLLQGEGKDLEQTEKYFEWLKKEPMLSEYQWRHPQPTLLPNGNARFQVEGIPAGAEVAKEEEGGSDANAVAP